MYQSFELKTITGTPDNDGLIDTGIKWSDYVIVSVYCLDRAGWHFEPWVNNSSSSLSANNWLIRVYTPTGSTPSGSYNINIFDLKRTVFR